MGKVKQKETFPLLLALRAEINQALSAGYNIETKTALKAEQEKNKYLELQMEQFETIIKGYSTICEKKVKICPECLGAGAYIINGEVEECDRCDSAGWIIA